MGRKPKAVEIADGDREALEAVVKHPRAENREVQRARIVLMAADGVTNDEIAAAVGVSVASVTKWKRRYREAGYEGLTDLPRSGRPRTVTDDLVAEVVELTLESTPRGATHWSTRTLAAKSGLSRSAVSRIWQAFRLKPHRRTTFELSNDPYFVDKVRDVVGLYLHPPDRAVVFSVDEKTQIQALERTQTVLPLGVTKPTAFSPKYRRHGTIDLFAALEVHTGRVIALTQEAHRSEHFTAFLEVIDEDVDPELDIHVVVDNHSIHKSAETRDWLLRHPRFHLHFVPTYSSWLNQVEAVFSLLTERQLRNGVHTSVDELVQAIEDFFAVHNDDPQPFNWTRDADEILDRIARFCGGVLDRHTDSKS